jgi:5-methylcytosine-specific restriction endonuclease McrA
MKQYKAKKGTYKKFESNSNKRDSRQKRGYGSEWYAYRARFVRENPRCYICNSPDKINVDHIVPHKGNSEKFWDVYNFMSLCHSCHSKVTAMFDRYDDNRTEAKIKWIRKQRELYGTRFPVKVVPLR